MFFKRTESHVLSQNEHFGILVEKDFNHAAERLTKTLKKCAGLIVCWIYLLLITELLIKTDDTMKKNNKKSASSFSPSVYMFFFITIK